MMQPAVTRKRGKPGQAVATVSGNRLEFGERLIIDKSES